MESLHLHVVVAIREEITTELDNVKSTMADLHQTILELERVASRPLVVTIEECYDKLILTEEVGRTKGWKTRVATLKELMKVVRTAEQIVTAEHVAFLSEGPEVLQGVLDVEDVGGRSVGVVPTHTATATPLPHAFNHFLPIQSPIGCSHLKGTYKTCAPTWWLVLLTMVGLSIFYLPLTFLPLFLPCFYEGHVRCEDCHEILRTEFCRGCCAFIESSGLVVNSNHGSVLELPANHPAKIRLRRR